MNHNDLGIDQPQLDCMQRMVSSLERRNDAISDRRIRHAINKRLVEIRLFLRDGHLQNMNGGAGPIIEFGEAA